jgi:hypothetical protein
MTRSKTWLATIWMFNLATASGCGLLVGSDRVCVNDNDCPALTYCAVGEGECLARTSAEESSDAGALLDASSNADASPLPDAGSRSDAGLSTDAGLPTDAGTIADAGAIADAGEILDAGSILDGGTVVDAGLIADAGASMDAGSPLDSGPPPCNSVQVVRDNFDDGLRGPAWASWSPQSNGSVLEESGQLILRPADPSTGDANLGYETVHHYTLHNSALSAEVSQVLNHVGGTAETWMGLSGTNNNEMSIYTDYDEIHFFWRVDSNQNELSVAYDVADHRYWRIREAANQVHYEVSGDRITWNDLLQIPTPHYADSVQITLAIWAGSGQDGLGQAVFEDINFDLPLAAYCPISLPTEDFSGGFVNQHWYTNSFGGACATSPGGDQLHLAYSLSAGDHCRRSTFQGWDLSNDAVSVELVNVPTSPDVGYGLFFWKDDGVYGDLVYTGAEVLLWVDPPGSGGQSASAMAAGVQYLRLRHAGDTLYGDWSADGVSWNTLSPGVVLIDDPIGVDLSIGAAGLPSLGGSESDVASFDDLNLLP